ncbi:YncE family protein [Pseudotamlana haliotis]|nr:DUF5074 domain-containing protein [Tamlana haliotis]
MNKLISQFFVLSLLFLASCSSDDDGGSNPEESKGAYDNGILISGEGSGAGTGSISYVSDDLTISENLIYKKVNSTELGVYVQSVAFDDDSAFIIVDNANTITVVDRYTFEYEGEISTGLSTPRFMVVDGDTGYVTNWGDPSNDSDDFIAVVNLNSNAVVETIPVGNGPERIVENNGKLYVSHKGAYSTNNIISVIDTDDDSVEEITVKDNPDELFINSVGDLMVLSEGNTIYDADWNVVGQTAASISTIDTSSNAVVEELVFADGNSPSLMVLDGSTVYFALNNEIYAMNESASNLPSASLLEAEGFMYAFAVDSDRIYATDTSFSDVSKLNIYDLDTQEKLDTKEVALGAAKIYFN